MIPELIGQGAHKALLAFFNHVLGQHQWARDKLGMHVGRSLIIGLETDKLPKLPFLPPPEIQAIVNADGLLEVVATTKPASTPRTIDKASVEMRIKPSMDVLSAFSKEGPQGLLRHMRIEGDVLFAAALGEIASQARWDYEEDLSKVVGDIAAHRVGNFMEDTKLALQDGAQVAKGRLQALRDTPGFPLPDQQALAQMDTKLRELGLQLDALTYRMRSASL